MIIPFVPISQIISSDGKLNTDWRIYFEQLSNQLQVNQFATYDELTAVEISSIPSGQRNGRFVLDTDTGTLKVGFNDAFATVTTT